MRDQGGPDDLAPRLDHDQRGGHVGGERQGQPFQEAGIGLVGDEDLQQHDDRCRHRREEPERRIDHQTAGLGHGPDIGADVDGVGHRDQQHHPDQHRTRIVLLDHPGESAAGDRADAGAGLLDRNQQRDLIERRPQLAIAELGAGLGIGGDAGRVVVGRSGDDPWAQDAQEPDQAQAPGILRRLGIGLGRLDGLCVHVRAPGCNNRDHSRAFARREPASYLEPGARAALNVFGPEPIQRLPCRLSRSFA